MFAWLGWRMIVIVLCGFRRRTSLGRRRGGNRERITRLAEMKWVRVAIDIPGWIWVFG